MLACVQNFQCFKDAIHETERIGVLAKWYLSPIETVIYSHKESKCALVIQNNISHKEMFR